MLAYCRAYTTLLHIPHPTRFIRTLSLRSRFGQIRIPRRMEVKLTVEENELCTLLDECTKHMQEQGLQISCRIAGDGCGTSHDIDIALTDMMGFAFAERFVAYCHEVRGIKATKVTKIASNPEQSKHLETARTTLLGHEIDFVNLRNEEYAEHSRIPTQINYGTPFEDAMRRDITINALFYNVHTKSVEDYTGKSLDDLKNGLIRTPLPPRETFMDDPLRVLRCVRFASRYGFEIVPEVQEAARDPEIQNAIVSKISKERVGEEVNKMMTGRDPLRAVTLIHNLSLYSTIFHLPSSIASTLSGIPTSPIISVAAASILDTLRRAASLPTSHGSSIIPPVHPLLLSELTCKPSPLPRLYLACALTPFRGITYTDVKGKVHPAGEAVLREGLKLGTQNHYLDGIPALFAAWELLSKAIPEWVRGSDAEDRVKIASTLRQKTIHYSPADIKWSTSLLFSLVQDLIPLWNDSSVMLDAEAATGKIEAYNAFVSRMEELRLPVLIDAKTILDGRDVVRIVNAAKTGPWTAKVLSRVFDWQLEHPEGTKDQCEEWLKGEHAAGRVNTDVSTNKRGKEGNVVDGAMKKAKT